MSHRSCRFPRASKTALGLGLVLTALLPGACGHARGSGTQVTQPRAVVPFDRIAVSGTMDLRLEVGGVPKVEVIGEDNIVSAVETTVQNGTLRVRVPKGVVQAERITVVVVTPDLRQIRAAVTESIHIDLQGAPLDDLDVGLSGVGKLALGGLVADRITASLSGTGKMNLTGTADRLDFVLSGMGKGDFEHLCVQSARVRVNGMGQVTVNAAKTLQATVWGVGRVEYYGTPDLSPVLRGGGSIRSLDGSENTCLPAGA